MVQNIHTQRHWMIVCGVLAITLSTAMSAYAGQAPGERDLGQSLNCHPLSSLWRPALSIGDLADATIGTRTERGALCVRPVAPVCLRSSICGTERPSFRRNES